MEALNFEIRRYSPEWRGEWDAFVCDSRNATFLFQRNYMDYHSARFEDCSWIALKKGKIAALLPANIVRGEDGHELHSHQGLTCGGWLLPKSHIDGEDLLNIFLLAIGKWKEMGIRELFYKPVPVIYPLLPSQEDEYALFRLGAERIETNLGMAVNLQLPLNYNKLRRRTLVKAGKLPIRIEEAVDLEPFMKMLVECLSERHGATPVHSLEELEMLRTRFPDKIRVFTVSLHRDSSSFNDGGEESSCGTDSGIEAGVCVFESEGTVKAQYIATTHCGRELNLLTPLFDWLLQTRYSDRQYFDFGTSNEEHGLVLNAGLLRQKASYGATGYSAHRYRLKL